MFNSAQIYTEVVVCLSDLQLTFGPKKSLPLLSLSVSQEFHVVGLSTGPLLSTKICHGESIVFLGTENGKINDTSFLP